MRSKTLVLTVLFGLVPLCGCQSLSGTSWVATEIKTKTESDPASAAEIRAILVEFGGSGSLKTTVQRSDGSIRIEDEETYTVQGDTMVIKHPNYEKRFTFQLRDDALFIQSDEYDVTFTPHIRTPQPSTSERPAMFRPSYVKQPEYRRVSYSRR